MCSAKINVNRRVGVQGTARHRIGVWRRFTLAALAMATLAVVDCFAQSEETADTLNVAQRLEELFFEWKRLDRPGGAVVVIKDGHVVYQEAYGRASMEHEIHNTTKTLFDGVSIAMPVTGMAIETLEELGKLSLDDDVRKHVPDLPDYGKAVTLRHLLNHTSGIWDWSKILLAAGRRSDDVITFDQILRMAGRQKDLLFDPGSEYRFSRTNYNLLAEVVQRVTGQSFRDWSWDKLFRPLGMLRTVVRDRHAEPVENQAYAYDFQPRRGYRRGGDNLAAMGSDCLLTSVEDMSKWLINLDTKILGGPAVIEKILTPSTLGNGQEIPYAYGWEIDTYQGLKRYKASGQREGHNSALHYYPQQRFAVLLLCNWVSRWIAPVHQAEAIADIYLEAYLEQSPPSATPAPSAPAEAVSIDPAVFEAYEGDYRWEPGLVVSVQQEDGQLLLTTPYGGRFELQPQSEEKFQLLGRYRLTFQRSEEGIVRQILIQRDDGEDVIAPKIELVQPTPNELMAYTGTYSFAELDVHYSVVLQDGGLAITHSSLPTVHLRPEARDHFLTDSENYNMVTFTRDDDQQVSGFRIMDLDLAFQKR